MRGDLKALLEVLWEDAEAAMAVFGADRQVLQANPAAMAVLERYRAAGGDPTRVLAQAVCSEDGQEIPDAVRPLSRALAGEVVPRTSMLVKLAGQGTGERRMVISARPLALEDGSGGALLTWHDVTDSWQTQQQTRTELTRLGQLLEGATDHAIVMLDAYGMVMTWSESARRLQGYTQDEAVGMSYADFFDPGDRTAGIPEQVLTRAVAAGRAVAEGKRIRKDGSIFWAHATVTAVRDDDGQLRGFVKVTQDVSDRVASQRAVVRLNAELQQINGQLEERVTERTAQLERQAADLAAVNAELEAFSYSVSHDLRAPLRAMSGYARILKDEFGEQLPPQGIGYLNKVQDNAIQMGSLIDALLSFSRLQRQNLNSGQLDMSMLVRDCWESLAPARDGRHITLELRDLPPAAGDPRLLRQVWINLLDNAIKYTSTVQDAQIRVSGHADEVGTTYLVTDNGAGFDMAYAGKLGQVFQRLHRAEDFSGTGIGLALVQRIVSRHGGRLIAQGEPGKGAVMGFTLPHGSELSYQGEGRDSE